MSADDLILLNAQVVQRTAESHRVVKPVELESASARPIDAWEDKGQTNILRLGLLLMEGICRSQPFEEGNIRSGFNALIAFCEANGVFLDLPDIAETASFVTDVALNKVTIADLYRGMKDSVVVDQKR